MRKRSNQQTGKINYVLTFTDNNLMVDISVYEYIRYMIREAEMCQIT